MNDNRLLLQFSRTRTGSISKTGSFTNVNHSCNQ